MELCHGNARVVDGRVVVDMLCNLVEAFLTARLSLILEILFGAGDLDGYGRRPLRVNRPCSVMVALNRHGTTSFQLRSPPAPHQSDTCRGGGPPS